MRNHLPQLSAGAQRVETIEVVHPNGEDKTYAVFYQTPGTRRLTVLLDSFRDGGWDSVLLPPEVTEELRKDLNRLVRRDA